MEEEIKIKTKSANELLSNTKTVHVLEVGGKNLKSRLENLVHSSTSDVQQVK